MKMNQFNRVLSLVRHTGDRVIVADPETDEVFVLMNLNDYEHLLKNDSKDFSGDFFSNTETKDEVGNFDDDFNYSFGEKKFAGSKKTPSGVPNFNSTDESVLSKKSKNLAKNNQYSNLNFEDDLSWSENSSRYNNYEQEESLGDLPEEEEKFYLEPVDF